MSKKKYWSKCLFDEWDTLRSICTRMHWTEKQGVESLLSKMFMQMKNMFETCRSQTAEVPEFFHAATGTNPFL